MMQYYITILYIHTAFSYFFEPSFFIKKHVISLKNPT